jgi:hypothetical protein
VRGKIEGLTRSSSSTISRLAIHHERIEVPYLANKKQVLAMLRSHMGYETFNEAPRYLDIISARWKVQRTLKLTWRAASSRIPRRGIWWPNHEPHSHTSLDTSSLL